MGPLRRGALTIPVAIRQTARGVAGIRFGRGGKLPPQLHEPLARYFAGQPVRFRVPLDLSAGTPFQRRVWRAIQQIPYGQTRSYGWIARQIGRPGAARAVGAACGANPVPILIPCHRVIASNGQLGGYSGGCRRKRWLLRLEGNRSV